MKEMDIFSMSPQQKIAGTTPLQIEVGVKKARSMPQALGAVFEEEKISSLSSNPVLYCNIQVKGN